MPVADLRAAVAHLRTCRPTPPDALLYRLRALVDVYDQPDLFTDPQPTRDIVDAYLPPMHNAPTTQAMRRKVWPRTGSLRLRMVRVIANAPGGMTDDDLEVVLARSHQSTSACRNGLVADGWLVAATHPNGSAMVRRNRHGNEAQVWEATPAALARLQNIPT